MITTVTLNAAIDKTYYLESFQVGQVWRVKKMRAVAGGKGINVARVIQQLGHSSHIIGFIGGHNGQFIRTALDDQKLKHQFVEVLGESRINLNIIDAETGTSTEILETGPSIEQYSLTSLIEILQVAAKSSKIVVLSGSLPPGIPLDFYKILIEIVQLEGALAILDTSGVSLEEALKAKPFMIKPNEDELRALTGCELSSDAELLATIKMIMAQGIACVAVSLGSRGAVVGYQGRLYRVEAPKIEAVNPVGSGDSFTAGFAVALEKGLSIEECLKMAAAAGAANAMTEEAGHLNLEDYQQFLMQAKVTNLDYAMNKD
jgi:tagatose 6-phosphate kinase